MYSKNFEMNVVSLCVLVVTVRKCISEQIEINTTTIEEPPLGGRFGVYHSLEDTLATLNRPEYKDDQIVQRLLKTYEEKCVPDIPKKRKSPIRRPFVVVESNHKEGKKIFGKILADSLTGTLQTYPPKCLEGFVKEFHYSTTLRRAYLSLCNYAMAHNVRVIYYMQPVIVTGYWLHQASLFYAKEFSTENLPPVGSPLLQWPHDLLVPDMMFYINVTNENLKKGEKPLPTRPKVVEIFHRMRNPNTILLNQRNVMSDIALITEVYISSFMERMKKQHIKIK
uniref:Uncharacterized protein n=1 Tax=Clastoptera arizonana TaxID=38151 RepID=A0A1B6DBR7_9HEMI